MNTSAGEHPDDARPEHPDDPVDPGAPAPGKPAAARADKGPVRAGHGYMNEVRWQSGQGRQPYANRGPQEAPPPNLGDEVEAGNRGERSGNTLDQMAQVKQKP